MCQFVVKKDKDQANEWSSSDNYTVKIHKAKMIVLRKFNQQFEHY